MSQTVSTTNEIITRIYADKGIVRFKKVEKETIVRGWWICLSDMAAFYPQTDGKPFNLENWLNLNPESIFALDRFLERTDREVWGAYSIAIELARFPQQADFNGFPFWLATATR